MAEGAQVALVSRTLAHLDAAQAALGEAFTWAADLRDPDVAGKMVNEVEARFGPIDILVNSAGAALRTAAEDLTPAAWHAAMDAKFFSYIHVIDPMVKRMAARGAGVIVNIIGQGGKVASPVHLAGGAANAALMLATAGLAHTYASRGVRVVGLNPGLTRTERMAEGMRVEAKRGGITEQQALEQAMARLAMGRLAEADEIARIAVFASSAHGTYLTGANISVDGASTPMVV
jgi:NAD(P)-dependent dehydrogenase (short-subunit alcohol dehydrogenase family)